MRTIEERLDKIRKLMEDDDFLESKGISNEVNIRIFCYDPEDEMAVRHFISQIKTDQDLHCNLIERNLYEIFLAACDDIGITDSIAEMEESDGGPFLLEQLHAAIGVDDHVDLPLVHGDGHPAHGVRLVAQLFQLVLYVAGGLARPGEVVPGHLVGQMQHAH